MNLLYQKWEKPRETHHVTGRDFTSQECAQLLKEAAEVAPFDEVRRLDGEARASQCMFSRAKYAR